MDIQQLLVSLGAPAVVTGVIAYLLKNSIEKVIDSRFKLLEERNKLFLAENTKKQAELHDKRTDLYRTLLTLIYRARNATKEALDLPAPLTPDETRKVTSKLRVYHSALTELLYEERAFLPDDFFGLAHDLKAAVSEFISRLEYRARRANPSDIETQQHFEVRFRFIDKLYQALVDRVHHHIDHGIQPRET